MYNYALLEVLDMQLASQMFTFWLMKHMKMKKQVCWSNEYATIVTVWSADSSWIRFHVTHTIADTVPTLTLARLSTFRFLSNPLCLSNNKFSPCTIHQLAFFELEKILKFQIFELRINKNQYLTLICLVLSIFFFKKLFCKAWIWGLLKYCFLFFQKTKN